MKEYIPEKEILEKRIPKLEADMQNNYKMHTNYVDKWKLIDDILHLKRIFLM